MAWPVNANLAHVGLGPVGEEVPPARSAYVCPTCDSVEGSVTGETLARLRKERDAWRALAMALRGDPTSAKLTATGAAVRALLTLGIDPDTGKRL